MTNAIRLTEKGIVIATQEPRVAEWIGKYVKLCIDNHHALRYATNEHEFDALAKLPRVATAFIEVDFFGDKTLAQLDFLHKQYPSLQVILFAVSDTRPEDSGVICAGAPTALFLCVMRQARYRSKSKTLSEGLIHYLPMCWMV